MNELIFFLQTTLVLAGTYLALKLGKSALTTWIAFQALIANLFVLKQINLFSFDVTASDVFAIGSLLGLNSLQEYFGKEEAKKATWISFFILIFFTLVSTLHLYYIPNSYDESQSAFLTIFSKVPRLLIASMSAFFIVQQFDIWLFSKLKTTWSFATRVGISSSISQLLDTFLFSFLGLYGVVESFIDVFIVSYTIKLIVILSQNSFIRWIKA